MGEGKSVLVCEREVTISGMAGTILSLYLMNDVPICLVRISVDF